MNRTSALLLALLLTLAEGRLALADAPPATEPSATQPSPDKWQYTLFNPTPASLMRPMDTDRPNITNTPHTIDAGHLQIEMGAIDYVYSRDRYAGGGVREDDFAFGQFNFRFGVLDDLELNAVINAYDLDYAHDYSAGRAPRYNGFGDTVLGGKLNFWGDEGSDKTWATAFAVQPQLKFPTARSGVGNGRFEFSAGFPFLMNLPEGFHLGLQMVIADQRNLANAGYVTGWQNSICIDRVFFDKLDPFVEYAFEATSEHRTQTAQTIDLGCTYALTDNIVLDAEINFGLNRASNTIEVLSGISVRF